MGWATLNAASARAQAVEACGRAASLRSASAAQRRRAEEIADRLARTLTQGRVRALGDRGGSFALVLPRLRPMVRLARNDLRRWLEDAGLPPEVVADATLACSEACANAVEHPVDVSRHRIEVEARRRDSELELRVRDFGSWSEHRRSEQRGRGLSMIGELMDSVDVRRTISGSEIVMRRSVGQAPCGSGGAQRARVSSTAAHASRS